jgi:hypothetical protein
MREVNRLELEYEIIQVDLIKNKKQIINATLKIYEEAPDDRENVLIELFFDQKVIRKKDENFFYALQALRRELELEKILIMCNGGAENVYPSPMIFDMGPARKAYILKLGCYAKQADVVDIFEKADNLKFSSVDEQTNFYEKWINSIPPK